MLDAKSVRLHGFCVCWDTVLSARILLRPFVRILNPRNARPQSSKKVPYGLMDVGFEVRSGERELAGFLGLVYAGREIFCHRSVFGRLERS